MTFLTAIRRSMRMLAVASVLMFSSGCVYLIVGGIGAVGGYVVSPDTVEGLTESDEITVWDKAVEISSIMGIVLEQNEDAGTIVAKISKARVNITIVSLNDTTVKVTVKARRAFLPKISIAQDVFVKIMSGLD